jgi:predicted ATPase
VVDLGGQSLKGFAERMRAWRAVAENRTLSRFEALRSGATPLVGRDEEMELLTRRWGQAKTSGGRVVLISGEAGVGKSRLAVAMVERLRPEPHKRLRYFGSPHRQESPLYPFIDQLERAARFERDDTPEAKLGKLEALFADTSPPDEDVALIAELLSLPVSECASLRDLSPQRKKAKTFEALIGQMAQLAARVPVLVVFEDIHWLDPSSRDLLDQVIERISVWPALLVATFRPEFQPPWTGHPQVTTLALTRLGRRETASLVGGIAGEDTLPAEIVDEIIDRTDGVPLFVEELTKAVVEARTSGETAALLAAAPRPGAAVPATLHASLMARLDHLGSAKEVAQIGAAIGRTFDYELLAAVSGWKEAELMAALRLLVEAGLVFGRGVAPQSTYLFKHALVQDAAYGSLLRSRRQVLHRKIAEALESVYAGRAEAEPELIALHLTEAALGERAIDYWLKAGRQAMARSAMVEAVSHLRKGLGLLSSRRNDLKSRQQELELQIALGRALIATRGYSDPAVRTA